MKQKTMRDILKEKLNKTVTITLNNSEFVKYEGKIANVEFETFELEMEETVYSPHRLADVSVRVTETKKKKITAYIVDIFTIEEELV